METMVIDFLLELQMMFLVEMIESEEILKAQKLFEMVEGMETNFDVAKLYL